MIKPCWLYFIVLFVSSVFLSGCAEHRVVHISSDPSGAVVFYNNKVIGETPLDVTIDQHMSDYSYYSFRVIKDNYRPANKSFKEMYYHQTVEDVIPPKIHFVLEKRKKYTINITSEPSGAMVTLNGEVIGETPFIYTIREMVGLPRTFDFVAVKEGFPPSEKVLKEFQPQDNGATYEFPKTLHFLLTK